MHFVKFELTTSDEIELVVEHVVGLQKFSYNSDCVDIYTTDGGKHLVRGSLDAVKAKLKKAMKSR